MANRYWVGGTASWDGTAGTKWAATSGGAGGQSVPTTSDAVFFDAASGASTVSILSTNNGAASINCTGFTGTISGTGIITVAGSVTLVSAMGYTHTGTMTFTGSGTLTTAGKAFTGVNVNGAGITLTLGSALNTVSRGVTVTQGTFTTAGFSISCGSFASSNTNVRTINLGASTVSVNGSITFTITTNLTFNVGTSQINMTSVGSFSGGSLTFNNVSLTAANSSGIYTLTGSNTFNNLTLSIGASSFTRLLFGGDQTITGTLTAAGSSQIARAFLLSNQIGTSRTLTVGTLSAANCDFRDIALAGAAAPASPSGAGDCGGNSGITFPAAKTVYRVSTATLWQSNAWAATSGGGASLANFPLAQDTAVIDNATTLSGALSLGGPYNIGTFDCSLRTNAITLSFNSNNNFYGSFVLGSGITANLTSTNAQSFSGRSVMNFDSAGKTLGMGFTVDAPGGTLRFAGPVTVSLAAFSAVQLASGTLDLNNFNLTLLGSATNSGFGSNYSSARTLAFGTGIISINNPGDAFVVGQGNFTVTGTPVVNITNPTATATTVAGGASTLEGGSVNFNFTAGTYAATVTGSVRSLNFTGFAGTLNASTRTIFGDLTLSTGMTLASGAVNTTFGSTSGTQRTIRTNGRTINVDLIFDGVGGSWRLLDALTVASSRDISHINGTIDLNGFTLIAGFEYITVVGTKNLTFNGGTLTCSGVGGFNNAAPTGFTTTAGTGTGTINMIGVAPTFAGGGSTYNCTLNYASTGDLTITGNNTITTISNSVAPTAFLFQSGSTTTLTNWNINGTPGNRVDIISDVVGSHTLSKASGTVSADYLLIQDSIATGGAIWLAGANSIDSGGNSGWIFSGSPPVAQSNFLMLMG